MSKRVGAVLVGTLLAWVAASVWVPTVMHSINSQGPRPGHGVDEWRLITNTGDWHRLWSDVRPLSLIIWRVRWVPLIAQQATVLLIGGGLLTWLIRRDRRRCAGAVPAA